VKIGPVDTKIALIIVNKINMKKKKLTQAKYIALLDNLLPWLSGIAISELQCSESLAG